MPTVDRLTVVFAPDWREGNPYQTLLAEALGAERIQVHYIRARERGFPLTEAVSQAGNDLIHLHWPEGFFNPTGRFWRRGWRKIQYFLDLRGAASKKPLILTAHNLYPHDRWNTAGVHFLIRETYRRAAAVIAHSSAAAQAIHSEFKVPQERLYVIPHGDAGVAYPELLPREVARQRLNLDSDSKVVLMLGAIESYKGIDDAVRFWRRQPSLAKLFIVGPPANEGCLQTLRSLAGNEASIHFEPRWQTDHEVVTWLSAADAALFNYRAVLTSGAAVLARSLGIPVLLPSRLVTVDLLEPHPLVFRFRSFESDFSIVLEDALQPRARDASVDSFRVLTAWPRVAQATGEVYRAILRRKI